MKRGQNQRSLRTGAVRALSFAAAAILAVQPAFSPVLAADSRVQVTTTAASQMNARFLPLGIGKSMVVDLPRDIKDVLVAE